MGIVFKASADIRDLTVWSSYGSVTISSTFARTGSYSFRIANGATATKQVPSRSDYYVKVAALHENIGGTGTISFRESTTDHLVIFLDYVAGTVAAKRNTTLLGTSASVLFPVGAWSVFEIYGNIHDSTGSVAIKLNGTEILALTNQDTRDGATGVIDNIYLLSGGAYWYIDDFVVRDDDWPGTGGLYLLTADGDGSDTGWTASAGNRWDCVDEVPPSATDYISTAGGTPNTKNTFTFANLGITPDSIRSVSVLAKAKLAASGAGVVRPIVKSGSTYSNGSSTGLSVSEQWLTLHTTVDPDTSAAWDLAGVNALSAGVETQ